MILVLIQQIIGKKYCSLDTIWTLEDNNKKSEELSISELFENKVVV